MESDINKLNDHSALVYLNQQRSALTILYNKLDNLNLDDLNKRDEVIHLVNQLALAHFIEMDIEYDTRVETEINKTVELLSSRKDLSKSLFKGPSRRQLVSRINSLAQIINKQIVSTDNKIAEQEKLLKSSIDDEISNIKDFSHKDISDTCIMLARNIVNGFSVGKMPSFNETENKFLGALSKITKYQKLSQRYFSYCYTQMMDTIAHVEATNSPREIHKQIKALNKENYLPSSSRIESLLTLIGDVNVKQYKGQDKRYFQDVQDILTNMEIAQDSNLNTEERIKAIDALLASDKNLVRYKKKELEKLRNELNYTDIADDWVLLERDATFSDGEGLDDFEELILHPYSPQFLKGTLTHLHRLENNEIAVADTQKYLQRAKQMGSMQARMYRTIESAYLSNDKTRLKHIKKHLLSEIERREKLLNFESPLEELFFNNVSSYSTLFLKDVKAYLETGFNFRMYREEEANFFFQFKEVLTTDKNDSIVKKIKIQIEKELELRRKKQIRTDFDYTQYNFMPDRQKPKEGFRSLYFSEDKPNKDFFPSLNTIREEEEDEISKEEEGEKDL